MPAGISGFVSKVPASFFIIAGSLRIHTPDSIFRTSPLQRPLPTTKVASFSPDSGTGHSDMREDAWRRYSVQSEIPVLSSPWLRRETRVFGSAHKITVSFV